MNVYVYVYVYIYSLWLGYAIWIGMGRSLNHVFFVSYVRGGYHSTLPEIAYDIE